jgi:hypothetical protein
MFYDYSIMPCHYRASFISALDWSERPKRMNEAISQFTAGLSIWKERHDTHHSISFHTLNTPLIFYKTGEKKGDLGEGIAVWGLEGSLWCFSTICIFDFRNM